MHGHDLLGQGLRKEIGYGEETKVWLDNWILDPIPRPPTYNPEAVSSNSSDPEVSRWIQLAPSAVLVHKVLTICCSTALEQKKSGNSPCKNRGLDLNLRLSFPWILWHVWKARNLFLFEHVRMSTAEILSKALEEAAIWLNLHNLDQGTAPPAPVIDPSPQAWRKPLAGMVKCNVGCSWTEVSNTCGGGWIVRDSDGKALCHSRRMFGGISSCLQAEEVTFSWALAAMQDIKETTSDNGNPLPPPPAPVIDPSPQAWRKPLAGMVKCNVGCSWTEVSNSCGGAWIVRESDGKALCHSRRMFGGISSCLQAEQVTFSWALAMMQDLKETTSDNGNLLPHDT
ncbi:hypothetical protein DY000_02063113 [Brassica cretica]|uniref:RNase H type-1 domain-containing protein n=1 Tax=Brassica cretica TaxID=69181 RepID=A0ABQ7B3L1_BRACR|nr:hypothetical protein DY000_02063113 [Brassica cretica]